MSVIAVTSATGRIGGRVARRLWVLGATQRLVVRDPARAPRLDGAEVAQASYEDGAAMRRALEGASTLFLVSATEHPNRVSLHRSAVDAAVAAGVERIVYTSFVGAAPDATFTFARDHWHTEQHIRSTGVKAVCLRDNLYLDFFADMVLPEGVIRGPAGDGRTAAVARDDVADVAAAVLTGAGDRGAIETYDLTGPEALTLDDVAERITEVTGSPVRYERETLDEAYASRAGYGAPDWEVEGWVTTYAAIAAGDLEVVTDTVERLSGHPPTDLTTVLRRAGRG
jgi:uncharacterized protein YbjT (DUF2867 family)